MKKNILFIFALLPLLIFAQDRKFTLKGKLGNFNAPAILYVYYTNSTGQNIKDSCVLKNGVFKINGTIDMPRFAQLVTFHNGSTDRKIINADVRVIYLEPGVIEINSPDSLKKITIKGSKINTDYLALQEKQMPYEDKVTEFNALFQASIEKQETDEFKALVKKKNEELDEMLGSIFLQFVKTHPNSLLSLTSLENWSHRGGRPMKVSEVEPYYNKLSVEVRNSIWGKNLKATINRAKRGSIGNMAPDFTQNDPDGKEIKLSDYKGKYILLDFWASWCRPCRAENPNLVKQYNLYKDDNFTILSVSLDDVKKNWLKAIKDDNINWIQISDLKMWENEAVKKWGVSSIPDNFLISPEGKIIAKNLRGEELAKKLKELLGKQ